MLKFIAGIFVALVALIVLGVMISGPEKTKPRFYIDFAAPANENEAAVMQIIQQAKLGDALFAILEENTKICTNTVIRFGADQGPLYNSEIHEIWFPYSFAVDIYDRFERNKYKETPEELAVAMVDVLEFVLVHEIGHALVHQLQLPIVGKEEDAVDNFAAIMIIEAYENGAEIVASAADSWGFMSADRPELSASDFADEHSLDAQRFHQTVCLIYGSDPVKNRKLAEIFQMDDRRVQLCVQEYQRQRESWGRLLDAGTPIECDEPLIKR